MSAAFTYDPKASRARRRAFYHGIDAKAESLRARPVAPPVFSSSIGFEQCYTAPIGPAMGEQFINGAKTIWRKSHVVQFRQRDDADKLIADICSAYGLTRSVVMGKCRKARVTACRWEIFRALRNDIGMTFSNIARRMQCDHSTVMHALAKLEKKNAP